MRTPTIAAAAAAAIVSVLAPTVLAGEPVDLSLSVLGSYRTGIFLDTAAEIVAHDPALQRLFIVNGSTNTVDVVSVADPASPAFLFAIDLSAFGSGPTSVDVRDGLVAVAVVAEVKTDPGTVVFLNTLGNVLDSVEVGALPDMVTFTPDGSRLLVANEGEPNDDYTIDPPGSVSIIEYHPAFPPFVPSSVSVATATFDAFERGSLDASVRIFGPGATVAQDLEPEYIAVSADSSTAYVTLQENNAIALVDIATATVTDIVGLGFKDHSLKGNGLDASDDDNAINIASWPVFGVPMPDAIASFEVDGATYLITANEGDARDYDGFAEEERIKNLDLDPIAFPDAGTLQADENIGRLNATTTLGDANEDGLYEALYVFGGRSFTIRDSAGTLVYDSGQSLEEITAAALPDFFNANHEDNDSFDNRSDNKGPEPEGVATGVIDGRAYAFILLERISGIMVFDVTNPEAPAFKTYLNNRDFSGDPETDSAGDLGPEGVRFITAADSPTGSPMLAVANEVSGSTTLYSIDITPICPAADLDADCGVNGSDLGILLLAWGECPRGVDSCPADFNADGVVDGADLGQLLLAWTE
jgi:hypothetical protein